MSDSLRPHGLYSLGQNTGVGNLSLLQGIFPTQGSNPGLHHCRRVLYQLSHKGSPRTLEWVAYPFSRGSSPPRNRTGVDCNVAGGFFFYQLSYRETQERVKQWIKGKPDCLSVPPKWGLSSVVSLFCLKTLPKQQMLATLIVTTKKVQNRSERIFRFSIIGLWSWMLSSIW